MASRGLLDQLVEHSWYEYAGSNPADVTKFHIWVIPINENL